MDHGAPATEYDPEMVGLAKLIAEGEAITPEVVSTVWHKWLGDPCEEPRLTSSVVALTEDLQAIQRDLGRS